MELEDELRETKRQLLSAIKNKLQVTLSNRSYLKEHNQFKIYFCFYLEIMNWIVMRPRHLILQ